MPDAIPEMKPVDSSNIEAIGYDAGTRTLHVKFKNGGHYAYNDVPPEKHDALMKAPSKGKHFQTEIRGNHTHRKL